jgi:dihydrofolate synthase/folylpolyglutamate synthase
MTTYQETLDYLYHLEVERMDLKLERVEAALRLCGSPQRRFPALHIAGTNGKGSTAALLHTMLSAAGYQVGLFTSPHLLDFRERVRLGNEYICEEEVIAEVAAIRAQVEPAGIHLTPFEMMTVLAFRAFARAHVDIAVVEVGLGGRLDATNVLSPLVAVITSIALDHQAYLGTTLTEIAREKGGIIKPGVPVVIGQVGAESRTVLCDLARTQASRTYLAGRDFTIRDRAGGRIDYRGLGWRLTDLSLGLQGHFQCLNAAVALAALEVVQSAFPVPESAMRRGLQEVQWPGRLDIVSERPFVLLDGAHNPHAVETLVTELPALLQGRHTRILFSVMRDKDWLAMIPWLARVATEVIVTRVSQSRAEDPFVLQRAFAPFCPVRVIPDAQEACQLLLTEARADDAIVVCGSLFLVGEVLPLFPQSTTRFPQPSQRKER